MLPVMPLFSARQGQTALHIACREGHYDLARVLLEHGCSPNIQDATLGKSPLHMVTGTGNFDMCELLAVNGADVNLADNEGNTPLYIAAVEGHPTIQQLLLRYSRVQSDVTRSMAPPLHPEQMSPVARDMHRQEMPKHLLEPPMAAFQPGNLRPGEDPMKH